MIRLETLENSVPEFASLTKQAQQERRIVLRDFLHGLLDSNHLGLTEKDAAIMTSIMLEFHLTGRVDIDELPNKHKKELPKTKRRKKL